jgi:hypothetical protein
MNGTMDGAGTGTFMMPPRGLSRFGRSWQQGRSRHGLPCPQPFGSIRFCSSRFSPAPDEKGHASAFSNPESIAKRQGVHVLWAFDRISFKSESALMLSTVTEGFPPPLPGSCGEQRALRLPFPGDFFLDLLADRLFCAGRFLQICIFSFVHGLRPGGKGSVFSSRDSRKQKTSSPDDPGMP